VLLGLVHVAGPKAFRDKLKSGLANVELAQQFRELPRQNGFRDIGLRAAAFVARAAIVDVATFLDVSGQGAATMAAAHERRERKVILRTAELLPLAAVKRVLNPLEQVHRDQRRVASLIDAAFPDKLTGIDAVVQNGMHSAHRNSGTRPPIQKACRLRLVGNFLKREGARRVPFEYLGDDGMRRRNRVR
jgi:hypothetical protein